MSKMGQELDRRLGENKYELWEALREIQSGLALNQNNSTTESLRYVLKASLSIANKVLAKIEGK